MILAKKQEMALTAGPSGYGFSISGRVGYWTKYRIAGRVGSGRSVEIYDRVFPGMSGIFGYFRVCRVFTGIYGYIGYHLFFGGISSMLFLISFLKVVNLVVVKCNDELLGTMKN